ncbi:hypothetical protein [Nitrobacter hamburgensis]|uniref:hypothetical protein n=1 Tax=Nitrobacter hamburgensis TaxID=912 RepID=UPI00059E7DF9|nr:hypothetical protein [Nitrobacter hamburgensis]
MLRADMDALPIQVATGCEQSDSNGPRGQVVGHVLQLPVAPVTAVALMMCFLLRVMAIRRGWRLPVAKMSVPRDHKAANIDSKDNKRL